MPQDDRKFAFQPVHAFLITLALVGLFFLWFFPRNATEEQSVPLPPPVAEQPIEEAPEPPAAEPEPTPEPEVAVEAPEPEPELPPLPKLDNSDPVIKQELESPDLQPVAPLLTDDYYIRKAVRAVVAASNGEWVNQHRPVKMPTKPFAVTRQGDQLQIAQANYERYTPYISALESVGSEQLANMYERYYPLLEDAYAELGLKGGDFYSVTQKAINLINETPEVDEAELVHPSVMYKYKSKSLESLPEIQKLMLRMGPDNRARVLQLLSELEQELAERKPASP